MNRLFRSTTAIAAILGVITPTVLMAESPGRLAQADPVVVVPPGAEAAAKAIKDAEAEAAKAKAAAAKAKAQVDAAIADAAEPVVKAPAKDKPTEADAKAAEKPVVVAPKKPAAKAATEEEAPQKAAAQKPKAVNAEGAAADKPAVVAPAKATPKAAADAPVKTEAKANADSAEDDTAAKPVVAVPAKAAPKAAAEPKAEAKADAAKPVVVAPAKAAPSAKSDEDALAEALAAKVENKEAKPVVVPPKAAAPKAAPAEKPAVAKAPVVVAPEAKANDATPADKAGAKPAVVPPAASGADDSEALAEALAKKNGTAPVVVAPAGAKPVATKPDGTTAEEALGKALGVAIPAGALAAATGQKEAPRPVTVSDADNAAMAEALGKAQAVTPTTAKAADAKAPVVVAPGTDPAAAVASGKAAVVDALSAPATLGKDATSVVVTDGSARSSSEDFATTVAAAAAAAGKGPVDNVTGTAQKTESRDKDDTKETLAKLLVAGLGAYAVGKMIQNQGQVALNTGDRVVVQAPDGSQQIWRDDDALLLQPGARVTTENFTDGSSRSIVTRDDGSRIVTIRDAQLRVLRRTLISANGTATELINDAAATEPVQVKSLPPAARPVNYSAQSREADLRAALEKEAAIDRRFSLGQVRNISEVRSLVAPISIDSITFDTGSAAIRPDQAGQLSALGKTIADMVKANPAEVFLVEGYTDTVGQPATNLALSDRRAESLALALSEYFQVPPENLVVQGYGERFLKVQAEGDVRENRRVAVRRITNLLQN